MNAIIDIERRHPESEAFPVSRIFAETKPHLLNMPDGQQIEVYALFPQKSHSEAERAFVESMRPFFHRRIIPSRERSAQSIGGSKEQWQLPPPYRLLTEQPKNNASVEKTRTGQFKRRIATESMIINISLVTRAILFFPSIAYVGYINGILKTSIPDPHRLIVCVILTYAAYAASIQIETYISRYYIKRRGRQKTKQP